MRSVARSAGFGSQLLLAGFLAVISFSVLAAESRVALVIGNNAYPAAPLKNPVNDARAMATALNQSGFELIQSTNNRTHDSQPDQIGPRHESLRICQLQTQLNGHI